jgi:hypothetical protein
LVWDKSTDIEYKKLESIHCAIQEALIKLPDDVELKMILVL